ncbi:hypothetical protein EVAR_20284_1 [Eumeta japonica]|uniref:Uncharacterized protein n=1 Tax=Eumeta variegata TaxID=151549 RepID=A0A4C1VN65_EUMVA|nr:hypothetical protein EVAR_20284_1 [Eumeta japonica]
MKTLALTFCSTCANCRPQRVIILRLCAAAVSLLLGRIGRCERVEESERSPFHSGREIARSALSLTHSAQAERDNESCFFVRAAGVHRLIRRYHVKKCTDISENGISLSLTSMRKRDKVRHREYYCI